MLQICFRSVMLVVLFVANSAVAGPYTQLSDPEASRYAVLYAEQTVGKTPREMYPNMDLASAFGERVKALHKENGVFFYLANRKGRICRDTLMEYMLIRKTELQWKHGDLNAAQRSYVKKEIFEKWGKPLDTYIYLRSECGITFEAATEINKVIRESLGYPEEHPANAPEFPYD